jgi:hypothetical protein
MKAAASNKFVLAIAVAGVVASAALLYMALVSQEPGWLNNVTVGFALLLALLSLPAWTARHWLTRVITIVSGLWYLLGPLGMLAPEYDCTGLSPRKVVCQSTTATLGFAATSALLFLSSHLLLRRRAQLMNERRQHNVSS